ncbi:MAG: 1-acyl-sn-glycerol-3-phosphate acyltransferase [Akkermansiaceae bacterium]
MMGIVRVSDEELKGARNMKGPLIIASNHPAMWDALLLMRRFGQVGCVMKTELLSNPLLGSGARFAGFIASTPRTHTIRVAAERLAEGGRLLFFSRGNAHSQRTRRGELAASGAGATCEGIRRARASGFYFDRQPIS